MADRVVPVDVRAVIVAWPQEAPRGAVTRFCGQVGISRSQFYEIRSRAELEGTEAAMLRRRPSTARSPLAVRVEVEELAVRIRKELADQGWDHGPLSVRYRLQQLGIAAPAASTLARIFTRRGMVTAQPQKRPRSSYRRFEASMVHECWQLDSFEWPLADPIEEHPHTVANVYQLLDDRSRFIVASHVTLGETLAGALAVVNRAIAAHQVPHRLLSDNGVAFNQTRMGRRSKLVEYLATLGCRAITGRPGHPQTQGKDERVHATAELWLRAQPRAHSVAELQAQIDRFDDRYNTWRPHQSLQMRTPTQALADGPVALPPIPAKSAASSPRPVSARTYKTDPAGRVRFRRIEINLGIEHARTTVTLVQNGDYAAVFDHRGDLIRSEHLRPGQTYYGSPRRSAPRRNNPQVSTLT